jgi:hypothetical protein
MISRKKRDLARQLIDRFFACEITNDELMNAYPSDRNDPALNAIYERLWGYWSDGHNRKSADDARNVETRALIGRCLAFLGSDLEYEWPPIQWFKPSVAMLRLIGLRKMAERRARESIKEMQRHRDLDIWPFMHEEDCLRFPCK